MVMAEHENEVTVQDECKRAIREHETRERERERERWIRLGFWWVSSRSCNSDAGHQSWHSRNRRHHRKILKSGYGSVSSVI
jgi:hypothetical protein